MIKRCEKNSLSGIGLGLRRELARVLANEVKSGDSRDETAERSRIRPAFLELAPENWMQIGGKWRSVIKELAQYYPISAHGLSLSLGSPEPLDWEFLKQVKLFLNEYDVQLYSEHLSYSKCDNAHLYDLLPIPFRFDAVRHVAARIREVQDFLERRIAVEIVSYYTPVAPEMTEAEFVSAVLKEADCDLLLDVNNIYVNGFNHRYNPQDFLRKIPLERTVYIHMAGHEQESADLIIDTHGAPIADPVFDLFSWVTTQISPVPVLLERDFNIPEWVELQGELKALQSLADTGWNTQPQHENRNAA